MDPGTVIVQATAIVGAIAALIAIINGVDELREKRRKLREAGQAPATKEPPLPAPAPVPGPLPVETLPSPSPTRSVTNLPAPPSRLIGREDEVAEPQNFLLRPDVRLVTLIGPAGIGKTRLALQLAAGLLQHYPDGVFFVALGAVADPHVVIPTLAQVLDVREQGGRPGRARDDHGG